MLRTKIKKLLAAMIIIAIMLPYTTEVLAAVSKLAQSSASAVLTIDNKHPGGYESSGTLSSANSSNYDRAAHRYTYSNGAQQKTVFKIVQYGDTNYQDTFYCLDAEKVFDGTVGKTYQNKGNFLDSSNANLSSLGLSTQEYNAIVWLINNMYLQKINKEYKDTFIKTVFAEEIAKATAPTAVPRLTEAQEIDLIKSILTDDDIDVVQQLAIWHFTNGYSTSGTIRIDDSTYTDADTTDNGKARKQFAEKLYSYLVTEATKGTASTTSATEKTYPSIASTSSSLTSTVDGQNYKIGPFKVNSGNVTSGYTIKLTDGKNEIASDKYKIKIDGENDFTSSKLNQIFDKNYYIYIPISETSISTVQLILNYTDTSGVEASLWETNNNAEQPVLLITGAGKPVTQKAGINLNPVKADLALRKYIISVNDTRIYRSNNTGFNRHMVDTTPLMNGEDTAIYKGQKNPVEVSVGDKVVFEIRVYNEGQVDGTATKIVDFLPEYLTLAENSTINTKYGWHPQAGSTDGRIVETEYLATKTIDKFNLANGSISSEEVQIECVISSGVKPGKVLTNVAEIGADNIDDRDSAPGTIHNTDIDTEKYSGNNNKQDLSDKDYYYKGQQDDDDFEKLIIKSADLALRKYIVSLNGNEIQRANNPERNAPLVDVKNLVNKTSTTAEYFHEKAPVKVKAGDKVVYEIGIYNEGQMDGTATQIVDYLPYGLTLVSQDESAINKTYGWTASPDGRIATTEYLKNTNIKAFNMETETLDRKTVQIECVVSNGLSSGVILTNVAEIKQDNIDDIDSTPGSINQNDINTQTYKGKSSNQDDLSDKQYYYEGQQDDDDFEKLIIEEKADLALRKYIISINGTEVRRSNNTNANQPKIDATNLVNGGLETTAEYYHEKSPKEVSIGDKVVYEIRVYNEGQTPGTSTQVVDYLPEYLTLTENSTINQRFKWQASNNGRVATTDILSTVTIPAFNKTTKTITSTYVQIECTVGEGAPSGKILTNVAQIQQDNIDDIDSTPGSVKQSEINTETFSGNKDNKTDLSDKNYYYEGIEDEDDFEKLIIKGGTFDLALKKFIVKLNTKNITDRIPEVDVKPLVDGQTNASYTENKTPVKVETGDIVLYTIRVYNEGTKSGYVEELADYLPKGLGFLVNHNTNIDNYWAIPEDAKTVKLSTIENGTKNLKLTDFTGVSKLEDVEVVSGDHLKITSTKLKSNSTDTKNLIKLFDPEKGTELDYRDIQVACIVLADKSENNNLKNIAEITKDSDENRQDVTDRDSTPDTVNPKDYPGGDKNQDDHDYEDLTLFEPKEFDLSLQKFITEVDDKDIDDREPIVTKNNDGTLKFNHTTEPLQVANSNVVTYTIRVYNEGEVDGYAKEISDDIPTGLKYLPDHETNKEYGWKLYDKNGEETTDINQATSVRTDYLSKAKSEAREEDNLIKAYDSSKELSDSNPDYREVEIAFEVVESLMGKDASKKTSRIIINTAEITDDEDKDGKPVVDRDSTPDNNKDGEDDIDKERIYVKYFDLSLKKDLVKIIIIEDGKTKEVNAKSANQLLKVEVNRKKIKSTVVKFVYNITIKNEGEIEGKAIEIKDYIPAGLKFVEADNKNVWSKVSDKVIVSTAAQNKLLKPGETTTIPVTLQWENGENNLGQKVNTAEISKDENPYGSKDIDSTPDNKISGEDDIDTAPVLLSISTGVDKPYIILPTAVLTILVTGTILIKKFVL